MAMIRHDEDDDSPCFTLVTDAGHHLKGELSDLLAHAEEHQIDLSYSSEAAPFVMGNDLGAYAVELQEGKYDPDDVLDALSATTDEAWESAVRQLGELLIRWADRVRGGA